MSADDAFALNPRRRLGLGAAVVVVIVVLATTVGIGILRGAMTPTENVVIDASESEPTPRDGSIYVHVSGAVAKPGLYVLSVGDRVVDAVAAAGGFASDAAEGAVNLARLLNDGEQLVAPSEADVLAAATETAIAGSPAPGSRVNLNTADSTTLETLPGIGPALAQRIIDWRSANGAFTSVEDLLSVSGIGDKVLESLRELVGV
ncbi:helix-hairpin-helix domain-containing protein (plasmid) [Coraliomargarita sp. W4R53]